MIPVSALLLDSGIVSVGEIEAPSLPPVTQQRPRLRRPRTASLGEKVQQALQRAVEHCLRAQRPDGAWEALPDPRIFETALVGYALSCSPGGMDAQAAELARIWVAQAEPQSHSMVAHLVEDTLRKLVLGVPQVLDLTSPELADPVFSSRMALLYTLALHAGVPVKAPFEEAKFRAKVAKSFAESQDAQLKQWSRVDLASMHLLLQQRVGNEAAVREALRLLEEQQAEDGSFFFNPVSTALAYLALCKAAPGSATWSRCRQHLLQSQHGDGTWRFCTSDVWDTVLTVRSFRGHPLFDLLALEPALYFIRSLQNEDGGWSFRSFVESDNDTTAVAMLALAGTRLEAEVAPRAVEYFAQRQMENGLWRTWQFKHDPPVEDVVGHVVSALQAFDSHHNICLVPAKQWLAEHYRKHGRWSANWYHGLPYALTEVSQALGPDSLVVDEAVRACELFQNEDGGFGPVPGAPSLASTTGLMVAALLRQPYDMYMPTLRRALEFLVETQREDGTWAGSPEMCGPRPLLTHYQTHTQAFTVQGLMEAWRHLKG